MKRAAAILFVIAGTAHAGDREDIAKVDDTMLTGDTSSFAKDAPVFSTGLVQRANLEGIVFFPGTGAAGVTDQNRQITIAGDGKSAWVVEGARADVYARDKLTTTNWRVSEIYVKTPAGWRVRAAAWTLGIADATANKEAKAGKKKGAAIDLGDDAGDAALTAAFAKLTTDGLDATAAARKDLVAFGSAPGERTTGGAIHAKAWAAWKGKAKLGSSVAGVAPSGTTGWVAANVEVDKGGYKIPFLVFCVFDKTGGAWSLVHTHIAVL